MKVVYHVDEKDKWEMALANVSNMMNYCREEGEDCQIEVVVNGTAVADFVPFADHPFQEQMKELASRKVIFAACANALRGQQIPEEALMDFVVIVKAGVVELVKKQEEGFAYIRP